MSATVPLRLQAETQQEEITFHLIRSLELPVVLGFCWLNRHNPHLDWSTGTILEWGPTCPATCLLPKPGPLLAKPVDIF